MHHDSRSPYTHASTITAMSYSSQQKSTPALPRFGPARVLAISIWFAVSTICTRDYEWTSVLIHERLCIHDYRNELPHASKVPHTTLLRFGSARFLPFRFGSRFPQSANVIRRRRGSVFMRVCREMFFTTTRVCREMGSRINHEFAVSTICTRHYERTSVSTHETC